MKAQGGSSNLLNFETEPFNVVLCDYCLLCLNLVLCYLRHNALEQTGVMYRPTSEVGLYAPVLAYIT